MFSKIRKYLNVRSALAIYKTMILPYFDYGDIIFNNANIPNVKKLDKLHIRGLIICFKIQGIIDDMDLYNLAKVSNLLSRRTVHLRNYMFKNKNKCEKKLDNTIVTRKNAGPTFKVLKPNNEVYKRNVYYSGAIEWNKLDAEDRNVNEFFIFKRSQKAWLLNTYKTE